MQSEKYPIILFCSDTTIQAMLKQKLDQADNYVVHIQSREELSTFAFSSTKYDRGIFIGVFEQSDKEQIEIALNIKKVKPDLELIFVTKFIEYSETFFQSNGYCFISDYDQSPYPKNSGEYTEYFESILDRICKEVERLFVNWEIKNLKRHVSVRKSNASARFKSPSMLRTFEFLEKVAKVNKPILLLGETGVGKSYFAKFIHKNRSSKTIKQGTLKKLDSTKFIAINITGIPEELFESELFGHTKDAFTGATKAKEGYLETVGSGTLFLDEIGDLSFLLQSKLLTVIETGEFYQLGDAETPKKFFGRFIFATNKELNLFDDRDRIHEISEDFREDLYRRIGKIKCTLPPLRKRLEDIPILLVDLISEELKDFEFPCDDEYIDFVKNSITDEIHALWRKGFPGNIRGIQSVIDSFIVEHIDKFSPINKPTSKS